jgi:hypothetical protein
MSQHCAATWVIHIHIHIAHTCIHIHITGTRIRIRICGYLIHGKSVPENIRGYGFSHGSIRGYNVCIRGLSLPLPTLTLSHSRAMGLAFTHASMLALTLSYSRALALYLTSIHTLTPLPSLLSHSRALGLAFTRASTLTLALSHSYTLVILDSGLFLISCP